jgi:hypothetical protein
MAAGPLAPAGDTRTPKSHPIFGSGRLTVNDRFCLEEFSECDFAPFASVAGHLIAAEIERVLREYPARTLGPEETFCRIRKAPRSPDQPAENEPPHRGSSEPGRVTPSKPRS